MNNNKLKTIIENTFETNHLAITDYRNYVAAKGDKINNLFDHIVEDKFIVRWKKELITYLEQLDKGDINIHQFAAIINDFVFNYEGLNATDKHNIVAYFTLVHLEDRFPNLFNRLNITVYNTQLSVGKYKVEVEVLELTLDELSMCICDLDTLDAVEFIINRSIKGSFDNKALTVFEMGFEDIFLNN